MGDISGTGGWGAPNPPEHVLLAAGLPVPPLTCVGCTRSATAVWAFPADAADLMCWWYRLREVHPVTGLWPVLLGPRVGSLFTALTADGPGYYDGAAELRRAALMTGDDLRRVRGDRSPDPWSSEIGPHPGASPRLGTDRTREPQFDTARGAGLVGLVPAAEGWQVPGVLGWVGGLNYGVAPAEHVSVLRDWSRRFGAELVAMTEDQVLELLVPRPPVGAEEALTVAREQLEYCQDIVSQGAGSLSALVAVQVTAPSWLFWWD